MTGGGRDAGMATVWMVGAIAAVVLVAAAMVGVGAAVVDRHRADAAADAAALDAALHALGGPAPACQAAAAIARLDGATITGCRVDGALAQVEVAIALPGPLRAFGSATGRARAGPAATRGYSARLTRPK